MTDELPGTHLSPDEALALVDLLAQQAGNRNKEYASSDEIAELAMDKPSEYALRKLLGVADLVACLKGGANPLKATVTGSFHGDNLEAISKAVITLKRAGVHVLSPANTNIVACDGDFIFLSGDESRIVHMVQDGHLAAIGQSDFLWVVAIEGHVGRSTSMAMGCAVAKSTPIFGEHHLHDRTMREYLTVVKSIDALIEELRRVQRLSRG